MAHTGRLVDVIENIYFTFTVLNSKTYQIIIFIEEQLCKFFTHLKMCKNAVGILI